MSEISGTALVSGGDAVVVTAVGIAVGAVVAAVGGVGAGIAAGISVGAAGGTAASVGKSSECRCMGGRDEVVGVEVEIVGVVVVLKQVWK